MTNSLRKTHTRTITSTTVNTTFTDQSEISTATETSTSPTATTARTSTSTNRFQIQNLFSTRRIPILSLSALQASLADRVRTCTDNNLRVPVRGSFCSSCELPSRRGSVRRWVRDKVDEFGFSCFGDGDGGRKRDRLVMLGARDEEMGRLRGSVGRRDRREGVRRWSGWQRGEYGSE